MPETSPRKRFQIHLSTAIVLMFVAGGLIWANVRPRYAKITKSTIGLPASSENLDAISEEQYYIDKIVNGYHTTYLAKRYCLYGWPCYALNASRGPERTVLFGDPRIVDNPIAIRSHGAVIINILVVIAILTTTWYACERLIIYRRRASRKDA